jgi:phosphonopyruvate decarboxylase
MIESKKFIEFLKKNKINFFTGVPDSILKPLTPYLGKKDNKNNHIIAVNEGSAVSIGIGYHLSTKKIPCIYMQNSGLGNAINPLSSIAHKKVYSIPLLLLIGWRGSPNTQDEPQHKIKGKILEKLLKLLGINYCILNSEKDFVKLSNLIKLSKKKKIPVACLIKTKTLISDKRKEKDKKSNKNLILRQDIIKRILQISENSTRIISSTGYTSRELIQIRKNENLNKGRDFYMVGGMGHTSSVALGVSLFSKKKIICIDGDGSMLMHLGSLFTLSMFGKNEVKYVLINNNLHESVGDQVTCANKINLNLLSKSIGFKKFYFLKEKKKINITLKKFINSKGPSFLEVRVKKGSLKKLSRPKELLKIKKYFMK